MNGTFITLVVIGIIFVVAGIIVYLVPWPSRTRLDPSTVCALLWVLGIALIFWPLAIHVSSELIELITYSSH